MAVGAACGCGSSREEAACSHLGRKRRQRGQAVGLGFSSRFSPNNPVSSFRLYLLKVSKSLKYICACLPVDAREGNTFPAARASDVHADKR